ncbi:MAG: protein involved in integration/excision of Tn4371 family [Bradyrhizobium sp.]|nr:protein involved in integration/excision of Tn4371 family [Bradyrhizobium sp.]
MVDLKLAMLPDRTPVKLAITVSPDLHGALGQYAALYAEAYGRTETIADLVPAMLTAFLESDRNFQRVRATKALDGAAIS